ncbi:MAG: patatin-like phospholipase family protein [Chloroflexi bacterium]|nr:patatin-like phospholipase family protein [Chloroflexota bacterium]
MSEESRKIGLALGGGGGKGSAHIGVITALEALHVPIDVLTGTSIGGLVAALYAVGYQPYQIEQWFQRATMRRILDRDPTNGGFIGTRKIEQLLREAFGTRTFADATLPLALIAVDIVRGTEVIIRDGLLVDAVLASTAIPGLFPPVMRGEQLLVDGGVLNNVPVDVAQMLGADRVIGVDLGLVPGEFEYGPALEATLAMWSPRRWMPRGQLALAERALALMMAQITEHRLAETPPAVLLRPVVSRLFPLDFTRTVEGRMSGERAVFEQRATLEQIREWRLADVES